MARNGIPYTLALQMSDARRTALAIIYSDISNTEAGVKAHFDWTKMDWVVESE